MKHQILTKDYNSYGSRRGNHEVMMRGTFANIRIRNEMAPGTEGGFTKLYPEEKIMPVYDAVVEYKKRGTDLVIIGGKEYGTGSSRDWAAKGTKLLGVKVVIAESFERIHRSNLVGMGILPLQFIDGINRSNLKLIGSELLSVINLEKGIEPSDQAEVEIKYASGNIKKIKTLCRIDTKNELEYYKNGGILQYVFKKYDLIMDEDIAIINTNTRIEKIKNFFINNKKKIAISVSVIILIIFGYFIYKDFEKKNKIELANRYNFATINFISGDKTKIENELVDIVNEKDRTYSPLALYFLIDNNIILENNKINELFDIVINETSLEKEIKNLVIF